MKIKEKAKVALEALLVFLVLFVIIAFVFGFLILVLLSNQPYKDSGRNIEPFTLDMNSSYIIDGDPEIFVWLRSDKEFILTEKETGRQYQSHNVAGEWVIEGSLPPNTYQINQPAELKASSEAIIQITEIQIPFWTRFWDVYQFALMAAAFISLVIVIFF